jgi:hypothetical protein
MVKRRARERIVSRHVRVNEEMPGALWRDRESNRNTGISLFQSLSACS